MLHVKVGNLKETSTQFTLHIMRMICFSYCLRAIYGSVNSLTHSYGFCNLLSLVPFPSDCFPANFSLVWMT